MPSYDAYSQELLEEVRDEISWLACAVGYQGRPDIELVLEETVRLFEQFYGITPIVPRSAVHSEMLPEAIDGAHGELWSRSMNAYDTGPVAKFWLMHEVVRRFELHFRFGPTTGFWDEGGNLGIYGGSTVPDRRGWERVQG